MLQVNENDVRCLATHTLNNHILQVEIVVEFSNTMQFLKALEETDTDLANSIYTESVLLLTDVLNEWIALFLHNNKWVSNHFTCLGRIMSFL